MHYTVIDVLTGEVVHEHLCLDEATILADAYRAEGREIIVHATCNHVIRYDQHYHIERAREYQPSWRTVRIYVCPSCGARHRRRGDNTSAFVCGNGGSGHYVAP